MLRRIVTLGLAAALAGPVWVTTPASATVLFSCSSATMEIGFNPGLSHTPTAQTVSSTFHFVGSHMNDCGGGGGSAGISFGPVNSYPPRPLGCPEAYGGAAGNDYPNQTPLLIGADPSFTVSWASGPASTGVAKLKASNDSSQLKLVFVITAGQFSPPAGKKTKLKGSIEVNVIYGPASCADNSEPATEIQFKNAGNLFLNQQ